MLLFLVLVPEAAIPAAETNGTPCGVTLARQDSVANCKLGQSFGCVSSRTIWASGCRGFFRCAGERTEFQCGYPPGDRRYECSCDGSDDWRAAQAMECVAISHACIRMHPFRLAVRDTFDPSVVLRHMQSVSDGLSFRRLDLKGRLVHLKDPAGGTEQWQEMIPHLAWPVFETGHSDPFGDFILPLVQHQQVLGLPRLFGLGGLKHVKSLHALFPNTSFCALERVYNSSSTPLGWCEEACYLQLKLCRLVNVQNWQKRRAVETLRRADDAILARSTQLEAEGKPVPKRWTKRRVADGHDARLRIGIAKRQGRRFILNLDEFLRKCRSLFDCRCIQFGVNGRDYAADVSVMRGLDVYLSMHGGDVINAAHMRPDTLVVELVNRGFERVPSPWLKQNEFFLEKAVLFRRYILQEVQGGVGKSPTSTWNSNARINVSDVLGFIQRELACHWRKIGCAPQVPAGRPAREGKARVRPPLSTSEQYPLKAQPVGADAPTHLADGCRHVFLDVGANRGNHVRFLMQPRRFPQSEYLRLGYFAEYFGPAFADDPQICAFAFEPNPGHAPRLTRLARQFRAAGRRVEFMQVAALGRPAAALPMGPDRGDNMGANSMWGFSVRGSALSGGTALHARHEVTVVGVDLARFIKDEIVRRRLPAAGGGRHVKPPAVLIKMDPEGAELDILDRMLEEGVLCDVDLITWELHPETANVRRWMRASNHGPRLFAALLNQTAPSDRTDDFHSPSRYLVSPSRRAHGALDVRLPRGCKVRFVEKDDETYLLAREIAPRAWEPLGR